MDLSYLKSVQVHCIYLSSLIKQLYWMSNETKPRNYGASCIQLQCIITHVYKSIVYGMCRVWVFCPFRNSVQLSKIKKALFRKNISPRHAFLALIFNLHLCFYVISIEIWRRGIVCVFILEFEDIKFQREIWDRCIVGLVKLVYCISVLLFHLMNENWIRSAF